MILICLTATFIYKWLVIYNLIQYISSSIFAFHRISALSLREKTLIRWKVSLRIGYAINWPLIASIVLSNYLIYLSGLWSMDHNYSAPWSSCLSVNWWSQQLHQIVLLPQLVLLHHVKVEDSARTVTCCQYI